MKISLDTPGTRLAASVILGLLFAWGISEGSFALLKEPNDRGPQQVRLVIPAGTAERVARGQQPLAIPGEMIFVVGDTLLVLNQDSVAHQLGPVWVPSGASASLLLGTASSFAYECSFQPSRYFNLNVRSPTTWVTRLTAVALAGLPMALLIFLYGIAFRPLKSQTSPEAKILEV